MQQGMLPAIRKPVDAVVRKSNILARSAFVRESETQVSVWERRLVALVASKISRDDENFKEYAINVEELLGKGYGGQNLDELEKAVKKAMRRQLQIRNGKDWVIYTLFTKCAFHSGTGTLSVCFHPDLKPHFLQLKNNYVQYELNVFLALPSVYSQGLYEVLKSWANLPEATIPLDELHEILATPTSMRKDFAQFRLRVLEKAKIDIEKHAKLHFAWEPVKSGRSVTAIRFIFASGRMKQLMDCLANKQTHRNNADFAKFNSCFQKRGDACEGGHQVERICELCKRLR